MCVLCFFFFISLVKLELGTQGLELAGQAVYPLTPTVFYALV
jgi:hypothetical protein